MTPVAGSVANADQQRFVFTTGFSEGFFPPGVPVNRIVGMLPEIQVFFSGKSVGLA